MERAPADEPGHFGHVGLYVAVMPLYKPTKGLPVDRVVNIRMSSKSPTVVSVWHCRVIRC